MAVQNFKIALNAARFPLLSTHGQRAVFIPGMDSAPRTPRIFMGAEEAVDYNLPQLLYGENFMPTSSGVNSVGYSQLVAPSVATDFDSIFALRDSNENTVLYSPAAGKNYIYDKTAGMWDDNPIETIFGLTLAAGSIPADSRVTYAYVDGKTFVCYSRLKSTTNVDMSLLYWNGTNLVSAASLLANLVFGAGTIDGISSSNGYLLMWSGLKVAWAPFNGATFNYVEYANDAFTGAGSQVPEDIQGNIRAIIPLAGGFAMFTDKNAVAAHYYAQAINAPWVFREIANAGGLESYEQATVEGTLGNVYAFTTAGMQSISLNSAESIMPDVADFVTNRKIERYNLETQTLYTGAVNLDFYIKVSNIGNRYIVISYGTVPTLFSFALVYDLALKRWGKLRILHRDCFYYSYGVETVGLTYAAFGDVSYSQATDTYSSTVGQSNSFTAAQHALAFLKYNGEVVVANWSEELRDTEDEAVAIFGRMQLSRTSNIQLNLVELEGFKTGRVFVQPSDNGRTLDPTIELEQETSAEDFGAFGGLVDCLNFNVVVQGTFSLSTIVLQATTTGKI